MTAGVRKALLPLVLSMVFLQAGAQQASPAATPAMTTTTATTTTAPPAAVSLQELVRKPLVLRGSLGADRVQLSLQPKADEDGLEGKYFVFGQGTQILLAGEVDQNDLMMEESQNGKDVSGQWEGSLNNGVLSGTWSTLDGAVSKPFSLTIGKP